MEDNILLSIKRGVNDKIFYNKTFKIEHLNEFQNHFSYTMGYKFTNQAPGGNLYFNYTDYLSQQNDVIKEPAQGVRVWLAVTEIVGV